MLKAFREFAMKGNVMDLAVAVIMGAAFGAIVNSLVNDVIMPPIGLLLGGVDFSNFFLVLKGVGDYPTLAAAQEAGAATINYGVFLNKVVSFLIVSFSVFLLVRAAGRLQRKKAEAPAPPPEPSPEAKLLAEIRDLLKSGR